MAGQNDKFHSSENHTPIQSDERPSEEEQVQALTWALFDELITDDQMSLLNRLLLDSATARDSYLRCVQLHTELSGHFASSAAVTTPKAAATPTVLSFNAGIIPLELQSPLAEESTP